MLSKRDVQIIREVMREEVREEIRTGVPPLINKAIDDRVPYMIRNSIEELIPPMINKAIIDLVPELLSVTQELIKSDINSLRKDLRRILTDHEHRLRVIEETAHIN